MLRRFANIALRNRISGFALAMSVVSILAWNAPDTNGTPLTWGTDSNGNPIEALRWNNGDTINVFIEADPDTNPPDRSALLRDGMLRWKAEMANRGITINVIVGNPPSPPPSGTVVCTYEPSGTKMDGYTLGTGANEVNGISDCSGYTTLTGGSIIIRDNIPAGTNAEQEYLRNLGQHELTHVLGLADDANGEVTNHDQNSTPNNFNNTDKKEIGQLYPVPTENTPQGQGNTNSSIDPNQYDWDFTYNGPVDGHVALITMKVAPELIVNVVPPPGWIELNPADPAHLDLLNYPFYQNYMECGSPGQTPWDPNYTAPLAFRPLTEADALSEANPTVHISLTTQNAVRANIKVWAGGPVQILVGPVPASGSGSDIPTLNEWGLMAIALLLIGSGVVLIRQRRQREDLSS